MVKGRLEDYRKKRDFQITSEPEDLPIQFDWAGGGPIFVIQKHAASTLHYDFRIEVDGVLKSWAVPKGPSTDPSVKRLALPTEDHPLAYANFEGVIPEGEYGGGTMIVWDRGTYRNLKAGDETGEAPPTVAEQLEGGHATIWLEGEKLRGGYTMIRTGSSEKARWLLIKMDDEEADPHHDLIAEEPNSVKTGRSLDDIRQTTEIGD